MIISKKCRRGNQRPQRQGGRGYFHLLFGAWWSQWPRGRLLAAQGGGVCHGHFIALTDTAHLGHALLIRAYGLREGSAVRWFWLRFQPRSSAGLRNGTGSGRFSPMQTLSVAEVVTLTARLHAEENGGSVPAPCSVFPHT